MATVQVGNVSSARMQVPDFRPLHAVLLWAAQAAGGTVHCPAALCLWPPWQGL